MSFHCRPFRSYDRELEIKSWDKVSELKKGCVYQEVGQVVKNQHFCENIFNSGWPLWN